ncbi:phosphoserine aminotransferase [Alphaproteobacteria bacterium]|nr:phosphoserine aminotransferase [Alphaproteobacteria bacterium]
MEKPRNTRFSCGPTAKRLGWAAPRCDYVGRSHRSSDGIAVIKEVTDLQRKILKLPDDYHIGIVAASATGATETLLWTLLGNNGVDVLSCCVFSRCWEHDIVNELKLPDIRVLRAEFPKLPDTKNIDFDRDVVFCWTATTSGASFHNSDWIKSDRKGLTICDATSAIYGFDFDWEKFDAMAFSWQKGLGAEAGFGSIVLGPRAIERLESHKPSWPIPRIFRIANDRKVNFDIMNGYPINTPSMICVEEFRDNLKWAESIGGQAALCKKIEDNYVVVKEWIASQNTFEFLVEEEIRAHHVACFDITSALYKNLSEEEKWNFLKKIVAICEQEKVGFDFLGHLLSKPHLRVWCGPTIEASDLKLFLPWLEYAYRKVAP